MNKRLYKLMNWAAIEEITYGECKMPQEILGPHKSGSQILLQAFFPGAKEASVVYTDDKEQKVTLSMELADDTGFFAVLVPMKKMTSYHYEVAYEEELAEAVKKGSKKKLVSRKVVTREDCYRFATVFTKTDLEKYEDGSLSNAYEKFGANEMTIDGVRGIHFSVWAPMSMRVSLVGDFNEWNPLAHQMIGNNETGIYELFVPEAKIGDHYKFDIKYRSNTFMKIDPFGSSMSVQDELSSIVTKKDSYKWEDSSYLKNRKKAEKNVSIYQVDLRHYLPMEGSSVFAWALENLPKKVKELGFSHVELRSLAQTRNGLGEEGRIVGYFSIQEELGTLQELKALVDAFHKENIGVIFDLLQNSFSPDPAGLGWYDGSCLYEHQDPRQGISPDLGTFIFNYGRGQVKSFLLSNVMFYVEQLHADGICLMGVERMLYLDYGRSEWIPNMYGGNENLEAISYMKECNELVHKKTKSVLMIAQDSSIYPQVTEEISQGGLGFDLKQGDSVESDYLPFIALNPMNRGANLSNLTNAMTYAYAENFVNGFGTRFTYEDELLNLLPGGSAAKLANLRLSLAYMMVKPGKKLLGAGLEKGCDALLEDSGKGVMELVSALNKLYVSEPSLTLYDDSAKGFEWLDHLKMEETFISFVRKTEDPEDMLVVVANFSGIEKEITTGVPYEGKYKELINTDDKCFGGSGIINKSILRAKDEQASGRAQSIQVKLAPFSMSIMKFVAYTETELEKVIEERLRRNTPIKKKK